MDILTAITINGLKKEEIDLVAWAITTFIGMLWAVSIWVIDKQATHIKKLKAQLKRDRGGKKEKVHDIALKPQKWVSEN